MGVFFILKSDKPKDDKLEYFKQKIIEYLKSQDTIEKGGMAVGTIREWKGKKYIKGPDNKWRRYYNKETRGAKISIKHLIRKVETIDNAEDLMKLVLLHRDRFSDENGNPIPIVQELSRHISERQGRIAPDVPNSPASPTNQASGKESENTETESKEGDSGEKGAKYWEQSGSNAFKAGKPRKPPYEEIVKPGTKIGSPESKEANKMMEAWLRGWDKANLSDDSWKNEKPKDEKGEKGKKEQEPEENNNKQHEDTNENDDAKKNIIEIIRSHGVEITPQEGKYLFATGPADDGYFIINGNLDYNTYDEIMAEAESNGLKPPYHVYGEFETYQDKKNVDFHKLSETLRENKKSEEEKHRNRSEAMRGNQNAKKDGPEDPPSEKRRKREQTETKKARKQAGLPEEKTERTSAMKDSTWDPKSEDYRYKDTGYIAGSRKEKAQAYIRRMAKDGIQVLNTSIDWQDIEENERIADETITKQNLMGKSDWEALKGGGLKGNAGYLINEIYKTIASKPENNTPEARFNFSRALDAIRGRLEICKTRDEVIEVAREINGERTGYFVQASQTPEYLELNEKVEQLTRKLDNYQSKLKEKIYSEGDPYKAARDYLRAHVGVSGDAIIDPHTGKWNGSYYTRGGKRQLDLLRIGHQTYERRKGEIEERSGITEESINGEIRQAQDKMAEVRRKKNEELQLSNTMQKAWSSLGKSFSNAIETTAEGTKYHAKDSFSKHYRKSIEMDDDDFSWAEKKTKGGSGKQRKTQFELLVADHIIRKGGRDIKVESTEELKKAFNLRDVQSGNWVLNDPKSAKFHVDNIAMGLADMGDILGLPDNLLSLNGRLAMAIGARGHSKALAHYESMERVINITKMKGGGSLGHEWFHAFDNLIAEAMTGGKYNIFLTETNDHQELNKRQQKLLNQVKWYKQQRDHNKERGNDGLLDYYSKEYENAKKMAKKAGVAVDELENQEDHIPKVKAAFNNLVNAMMTGSAARTENITYTKDDYEAAQKFFEDQRDRDWIGMKEGMTIDEALAAGKGRGFRRVKPERLKKLMAAWLDKNPSGGSVVAKTDRTTSNYFEESKKLDNWPSSYWSKIIEMGARAFSSYLNDKMAEKGWQNNYLAHATENSDYIVGNPYPEGEERKAINAAFDELFGVIRETGAIRKAIMAENIMEKAGYFSDEGLKELLNETSDGEITHDLFHVAKGKDGKLSLFLTRILAKKQKDLSENEVDGGKDVKDGIMELEKSDKLEYFRKIILEHLDQDDDKADIKKSLFDAEAEEFAKSGRGLPVGSVRDWKGKKYVKIAPGKWKPKYDSHTRGAKMAISAIKKKIAAASDAQEMLQIVLENRERFADKEGHPLPFVQELSNYVSLEQEKFTSNREESKKNDGGTITVGELRKFLERFKSKYPGNSRKEEFQKLKELERQAYMNGDSQEERIYGAMIHHFYASERKELEEAKAKVKEDRESKAREEARKRHEADAKERERQSQGQSDESPFGSNGGGITFTELGIGESGISEEAARRRRAKQFARDAQNELDFILSTWLNGTYKKGQIKKNDDDPDNPTWVVFVNKQHKDKIRGAIGQWKTKGFSVDNHADEGFIQFSVYPLDSDEDGIIKKAVSEVLRDILT
jgi:hypothetical protein